MRSDNAPVLLIQTQGAGTESELDDLGAWLQREGQLRPVKTPISITDIHGVRQSATAVLLLVLATPAVVEGVKSLGNALIAWINARRPKIKIVVREGTRSFEIDAENPPNADKLFSDLKALLTSVPS